MYETLYDSQSWTYLVTSSQDGERHVPRNHVIDGPTYGRVPYSSFRSGVELPKYLETIKNGGDATTSFDGTRNSYSAVRPSTLRLDWRDGNALYRDVIYTLQMSGARFSYAPFNKDPVSFTSADNQALQRMYSQITKAQTTLNGIVTLGEISETIALLRNPLASLRSFTSKYQLLVKKQILLSKGKFVRDAEATIRSLYLEYVFGIRPLINDINAIASILVEDMDKPRRIRFVSTGSSVTSREVTQQVNVFSAFWSQRDLFVTEVGVRYFVGLSIEEQDLRKSYTSLLGFNPQQFVPSIYALIPFSWMADYFMNLKAIIEASTYLSLSLSYCAKTTKVNRNTFRTNLPNIAQTRLAYSTLVSMTGDAGSSLASSITVSRRKATLTIPKFQVKLPDSWQSWLNMAAVFGGFKSLTTLARRTLRRA